MDSPTRSSSLLAHIVSRFTSSQRENVATEALAYLLRRPAASAAVSVALAGFGVELPTVVSWRTQVRAPDDAVIPDLVGEDSQARPALIVEVKFGAGLTSNQPGAYLDWQDREFAEDPASPHLLVFLVPTRRVELLAAELSGLGGLSRRSESPLPLFEREGRPRVGVLGWGRMLAALEGELEAAGDEAGLHDLDQLRGLSNRADDEEMMPLSPEELSPERGRRQYEFHRIVHNGGREAHRVHAAERLIKN